MLFSLAKETIDVIQLSRFLLLLNPFLLPLLDMCRIDWVLIAGEHLCAAFEWAILFEWRRVDEFFKAARMEPMAAEGPLWHEALIVDALSQVRHQLVLAVGAESSRDEPYEVVSHILDSVVDLRFGTHLDNLTRPV